MTADEIGAALVALNEPARVAAAHQGLCRLERAQPGAVAEVFAWVAETVTRPAENAALDAAVAALDARLEEVMR